MFLLPEWFQISSAAEVSECVSMWEMEIRQAREGIGLNDVWEKVYDLQFSQVLP